MPASAEPPAWAGNHKGGAYGHDEGKKWNKGSANKGHGGYQNGPPGNVNYQGDARHYYGRSHAARHFDDHQRRIISDYFGPRFRSGRCPPGLAKKYNGCMPPGQARQWRMGYPLPPNIVFYNLPAALLGQLGYPGPGYRYVRVAGDILLIAAGTGLVIDAIQDLNSL